MAKKPNYSNYLQNNLINKKRFNEFNPYFINYNTTLIIQDIDINRTIRINNHDYYFKKSLRESDFVVISVGMEELANNYNKYNIKDNHNYFNKMYLEINNLIKLVKKYAQDKIFFLGYYNPTNYYDAASDELFFYINSKLNRLMLDNNIIYIDLYELVKENNYKEKDSVYLNALAHDKIASILEIYMD